ncbi:ribonuclease P protein component [Candidatus Peregrinibacteria bacterium RIFOXYC2_FULL_33_13]|nr:MAG: hypothetical protein UR27_C0003G0080 [Candidatus Peregrinibacteria bacterium GW2011_GWA2_33_10]KKP40806.1 MAG: hypothetical protein UR30_C0004G0064 [Candidatus Peregrinibacteria bacterium GW2011_GWC2_33_13]OGJ48033.1 MAG: ribonuclease P protein component [Candidatus Peregrinibacteria bacterium RIFOXYA2_FULL_33_7]OGJ54655.1 MAG: ribonuclease P protein component [Candidatus Peregrinibacteria bacterium RIFOXYC2_FULL_33_13]
MLPKKNRFSNKDRINVLLKQKNSTKNGFFVVKSINNKDKEHKFCIIISGKFKIKAVERNLLRRRIYDIIRLNLHALPKMPAKDFAIIIRSCSFNAEYDVLSKMLMPLIINQFNQTF